MDRLCRLIASFQNQTYKIQSNIFERIFEAAEHQRKDTEVVYQLTGTAIFITTSMKKHI